jgi:predicted PurR-regulated permease PerM
MVEAEPSQSSLSASARFSYLFMGVALILMGWLHLAGPLVVALFTYLALAWLSPPIRGGKWLAMLTVLVLLAAVSYALGYFVHITVQALPEIGDKAIPAIIAWAKEYGIQLPFTDYDSLKDFALESIKGEARYFGDFARLARTASSHLLLLIAGAVIAIGVFLNPRFELTSKSVDEENAYSAACREIGERFKTLYGAFSTVMGAQVIISAINTVLTAIFVVAAGFPYAVVVIGMTFLCGLVPVVGNLVSNSVVVAIGFTVSPRMALGALIFLIVIHKLEYFLNSKIVGWRIRNPFWLTLLGLLVGERLLGIPGMILGPVLLNYLRLEASRFKAGRAKVSGGDQAPKAAS